MEILKVVHVDTSEPKDTTIDEPIKNLADVEVTMNYRRLRHIHRCNNFLKINGEDVAQHSFYVTIIAMAIADEMKYERGMLVSVEDVMRKALLHDVEEAITGDIPHNVKHGVDQSTKESLEAACEQIADSYYLNGTSQVFQRYSALCKSSKKGLEGQIVDLADMLELAVYCYEEVCMGNRYFQKLFDKAIVLSKNKDMYHVCQYAQDMVAYMEKGEREDFHFL